MNKTLIAIMTAAFLTACSSPTSEKKVTEQIAENGHALTAEERMMAQANAKSFFEKPWPVQDAQTKQLITARGMVTLIRPSDSNNNGMVSAIGTIPRVNGGYEETKVYCGYRKDLVGCSDEDTVR